MDKKFGQVAYENIYFINNQENKSKDYSRIWYRFY